MTSEKFIITLANNEKIYLTEQDTLMTWKGNDNRGHMGISKEFPLDRPFNKTLQDHIISEEKTVHKTLEPVSELLSIFAHSDWFTTVDSQTKVYCTNSVISVEQLDTLSA